MKFFVYFFSVLSWMMLFGSEGLAQNAPADTVKLKSLLKEMVSREALARYPDPYYTTRQFSSYDRNAVEPDTSSWFANWDRTQFIRTEQHNGRKEYVMMDAEGPGAVVRFWMTFAGEGAGKGTLRIYFDGEQEPTIEGEAFEVLSGGILAGKPLSTSVSPKTKYQIRGHNLYLPLPFDERIKITYQSKHIEDIGAKSGGESVYYNINYRDYEAGTSMQTFSHAQLEKNEGLLRRVQERLLYRNKEYELSNIDTRSKSLTDTIAPGDSLTLGLEGPAAIRRIALQIEAENPYQALRSTVIKASFDGEQTVWVPVGDFFGTGYQYRESDTWYTTVTECGELRAYWVMPFKKNARITLKNIGDQSVSVTKAHLTYADWKWDTASMHFGASWQQYSDLYTGEQKTMTGKGGPFDINYTKLQGQGVYVGDVLTLFNTAYAWWGEGDEKIYIDGEDFPSHFGTGTEDYYGYAWVRPEVFTNHPFISQPDGSGNITPGYTVNMRFRSLDAIPFKKRLRFDMEMWHWTSTRIDYAPTTFYYLKPDGRSLIPPQKKEAQKEVALSRSDIISPVIKDHRMEGEHMMVDTLSGGAIRFQHLEDPKLSHNKQLWWREGKPGDVMVARFISEQQDSVKATARFVIAPDYGTIQLSINGRTVLKSFNGYHPTVSTRKVKLGMIPLKKGENTMRVKILNDNDKSNTAFFGLDYLDFEDQ